MLVWNKKTDDTLYEVRSAGNSLRLYTNGVFHSQFNPKNPASGGVWDLLFLPAFFTHQNRVNNVAVLGVGGGAVIRQLQHFVKPDSLSGVELDPEHLYVAKRFFQVDSSKCRLYEDDAVNWIEKYRGPRFDFIVEDLFTGSGGEPRRAVPADKNWMSLLLKKLQPDGILVMNFVSARDMRQSAMFAEANLKSQIKAAFILETASHENAVAAFTKTRTNMRVFRDNLKLHPVLFKLLGEKYRVRAVKL